MNWPDQGVKCQSGLCDGIERGRQIIFENPRRIGNIVEHGPKAEQKLV